MYAIFYITDNKTIKADMLLQVHANDTVIVRIRTITGRIIY